MATSDKLQKIVQTKQNIKQAIIDQGIAIHDNVPFSMYPEKISAIANSQGKWQQPDNWPDIREIFKNDIPPAGYTPMAIALTTTGNPETALSNFGGKAWKTSDGKFYNIAETIHRWDELYDIEESTGEGVRWVIIYGLTTTDMNLYMQKYYLTDTMWIYIDNCAFTQVKFGNTSDTDVTHTLRCFELGDNVSPLSHAAFSDYAFHYCYGLEYVNFPPGASALGKNSFYYCSSLKSIKIPDTVTSCGDSCFGCCFKLESLELSPNLTTLPIYMISSCGMLKSIKIPNSVTTLSSSCLFAAYNLRKLEIPQGLISQVRVPNSMQLKKKHLINLFNNLGDNTAGSSLMVVIGTCNLNKLTLEEKQIALNKNYTLS